MINVSLDTVKDAAEYWVREFNAIDYHFLEALNETEGGVVCVANHPEYSEYPMWSTMWQFNDCCDEQWLEDHVHDMAKLGFSIYLTDYGYFFGIDGAGYNFYDAHWIPLYKLRGLHWHKED